MIIGISGKMQSGKDTVGKIIQYLLGIRSLGFKFNPSEQDYNSYIINKYNRHSNWEIKRYGDKLKQVISLLTGIPVKDLEKIEVKNKVLGKEWDKVLIGDNYVSVQDYKDYIEDTTYIYKESDIIHFTVRKLFQEVGTDAMRNVIHPDVWVNALFNDYKCVVNDYFGNRLPNWIITDVRFPNELNAIEDREGFVIRVNSNFIDHKNKIARVKSNNDHESEIALDNHNFDDYINNNGTIEDLIKKVKEILIKHKLL